MMKHVRVAVAVSLGLVSQLAQAEVSTKMTDSNEVVLNEASLVSMEESWLQVPPTCKARGFNADPQTVVEAEMPRAIALVFKA